jgi:hypothetical protein
MLYLMAFGALVGFGAAYETAYESTMYQGMTTYEDEPIYAQQYSGTSDSAEMYNHDGDHHGDYGGDHYGDHHGYYDWLSPGGAYYWGYPSYYYSSWYYPTYTYTYYPTTYYTYPTTYYYTYPTAYTYSAPVVYDPWWAANVYGAGSTTYYYSSSSSWSYHGGYGGFFFGP